MAKTVSEINESGNIGSKRDCILKAAATHSLSHYLTDTPNPELEKYALSIANKVLDALRSVAGDTEKQCPGVFMMAVDMGVAAFVCDKMDSLKDGLDKSHNFYKFNEN
jgi:hypothetical protein